MFPIPFNFPFRKKDGSLTSIGDAISSGGGSYTLPTASAETKGGVKVGSGLSMSGETLNNSNPTPYTLPTASAETKGGVKVGSGLSIDESGVLSASGGGGGGMTLTAIDETPHGGTYTELSNVNLDEHDGLLVKFRSTSSSPEIDLVFKRTITSGALTFTCQIWDGEISVIRAVQYQFAYHKLILNKGRYIQFTNGQPPTIAENENYGYIAGLYYVDFD